MKTTAENPLQLVRTMHNSFSRQIKNFTDNRGQMKKQNGLVKNIRSNNLRQYVKFDGSIYATGAKSTWGANQKSDVNSAITSGSTLLTNASSATSDAIILGCIPLVKNVLNNSALEIFKLTDPACLALSVPRGPLQISLNIVLHNRNIPEITKTLIHECFHIACGGLSGAAEWACSKDKAGSLAEIVGKTSSNDVNPDSFAQFVVQ